MKVAEIAKELNTNNESILATLKSLKLKSKDAMQELSAPAISLLKDAFKHGRAVTIEKKAAKTKVAAKVAPAKKPVKKVTKEPKKKITAKDDKKDALVTKKTIKKVTRRVVKKTVVASDAKKKDVTKSHTKPKKKISLEPVITLKPLARKRKKQGPGDRSDDGFSSDSSSSVTSADNQPIFGTFAESAAAEQNLEPVELIDIEIKAPIIVKDFAAKMNQKPSAILKELMKMGVFANINQGLDEDIVRKLAAKFGFNPTQVRTQEEVIIEDHKQEEEDPKLLRPRAPVVTFMGHVDHGKTSLLDRIRKAKVADSEHGGITQHMGAYSVESSKGRVTFLDTPGHEAFTAMRARGAHITDIVVLVVAADEGIMPQTQEAIDHARAANVPIVVAMNKIDRPNANPDRIRKQLASVDLAAEDWGGKTVVAPVSALTGEGIDNLLELIALEAELLELKANPDKRASGIVCEAHLSQGKGVVSTLIVQSGTLREGDIVIIGPYYGKVKAMFDDRNQKIKTAGPSMPVEILGLPSVPQAGDMFYVLEDEKQAREITFRRQQQLKDEKLYANQKITLEDLNSQIQEGTVKELSVIIKADVQGSLEALKDSLGKIPNDRVKVNFIHLGVGDVNLSDILLAVASKAIIIAFHVGTGPKAKQELERNPVDVRQYRIIYDAVDDIRKALEGLLEAKKKRHFLSRIEIREVFKLSRSGIIAGCYVQKGKVNRKAEVEILRADEVVYTGRISSLKRFKDDVKEVTEGMECGIAVEGFNAYKSGDIIEAYEIESIAQKL